MNENQLNSDLRGLYFVRGVLRRLSGLWPYLDYSYLHQMKSSYYDIVNVQILNLKYFSFLKSLVMFLAKFKYHNLRFEADLMDILL